MAKWVALGGGGGEAGGGGERMLAWGLAVSRAEEVNSRRLAQKSALNSTSAVGWAGGNQSIGAWELRCDPGKLWSVGGHAPQHLTVPLGSRCLLRTVTTYERGANPLAVGCWEGFGRRFCVPRGYMEHYQFRVHG